MLKKIEEAVLKASEILNVEKVSEEVISSKSSPTDLVTIYDKKVQESLYLDLSREFPAAGFLGEEQLNTDGSAGIFIIDPIDGTTNFIKGLDHSAIAVGYYMDGEMKYGVVYNPYKKEMFSAEKGKGAYLNGKRIYVNNLSMERSVAFFGTVPNNPEFLDITFRLSAEIIKMVIDLRRFGTAELDFVNLACGRGDIYYEYMLQPWDYAAGALIAAEAGAIVSDIDGNHLPYLVPSSVLVGTQSTYKTVLDTARLVKDIQL